MILLLHLGLLILRPVLASTRRKTQGIPSKRKTTTSENITNSFNLKFVGKQAEHIVDVSCLAGNTESKSAVNTQKLLSKSQNQHSSTVGHVLGRAHKNKPPASHSANPRWFYFMSRASKRKQTVRHTCLQNTPNFR